MDFYVSPTGNDTDPGTKDKPFATLERARDAARQHKGPRTVWLAGGDYLRTQTLELTQADSDTTFQAMAGQTPRVLGGKVITGFTKVTDASVLERLSAEALQHVVQVDLNALGIHDFGTFRSRGFGRPVTPAHLELFFNGQRMSLPRWPKEEFTKVAAIPEEGRRNDGHGGTVGPTSGGFHYDADRPSQWRDGQDVWVHGYWAWDWANTFQQLEVLDKQRKFIQFRDAREDYGFRVGARFFFLNVFEELDQPGNYYVDREKGALYFWPPAPLEQGEAIVSLLESPLVTITGADNVTFDGVNFAATRGNAIEITDGDANRIANATLTNTGNYAIVVKRGVNHAVVGCTISHTGDGGVKLNGGDRKTLEPCNHLVERCEMHDIGEWSRCYCPAVLFGGVGFRVAHCHIHHHPHCAILFTGNEVVIEYNEIHHTCTETGDVGAIYTGRDWTFCGNIVRYNYIHHIGSAGHGGSMCVYLDDCAGSMLIYGNVFYKTERAAFIGGGRNTTVENNIFVECRPAVMIDGRGLNQQPVWKNNVVTCKERLALMPYHDALWSKRYPHLLELDKYLDDPRGVPPENNVVVRNIVWGGDWMKVHWEAGDAMIDVHDNYAGDPGFVERANANFKLRPDSPVFKLGFKPIPFDEIGLK